jgi:hypothetical protein
MHIYMGADGTVPASCVSTETLFVILVTEFVCFYCHSKNKCVQCSRLCVLKNYFLSLAVADVVLSKDTNLRFERTPE